MEENKPKQPESKYEKAYSEAEWEIVNDIKEHAKDGNIHMVEDTAWLLRNRSKAEEQARIRKNLKDYLSTINYPEDIDWSEGGELYKLIEEETK